MNFCQNQDSIPQALNPETGALNCLTSHLLITAIICHISLGHQHCRMENLEFGLPFSYEGNSLFIQLTV